MTELSATVPDVETSLTIGKVAERTGLSVHTLRYYESEGALASPIERNGSGHRVYRDADIQWLEICKSLRASGMPLSEIAEYGRLVRAPGKTEAARLGLLRAHHERLMAEIAQQRTRLAHIAAKIRVYEEHGDGDVSLVAHHCADHPLPLTPG